MKLSQQAWQKSLRIIQKIEQHPFNQQLARGMLPMRIFNNYLAQDSIYLEGYTQSFAYIIAKIDKPFREAFYRYMQSVIDFEKKNIHEIFNVEADDHQATRLTTATLAYTSFLLHTTQAQSAAVGVAAILPCFWVYAHVAKYLARFSIANNPYQKWIEMYSGSHFQASVEEVIGIFDRLALQASERERNNMLDAFYYSTCLEWHFWNDAYHTRSVDSCIIC